MTTAEQTAYREHLAAKMNESVARLQPQAIAMLSMSKFDFDTKLRLAFMDGAAAALKEGKP